ncbi:hypothetical protein RND71_009741 [Anisodus tanguticus]|uniref:glutathione transferase n=1 Tax=Anisodus tanguticus TaxID=243964 RepID=A0AAE1SK96_9SOLA|nr:hypothetical protein RND71_009741 [Anisodus tanguticus]
MGEGTKNVVLLDFWPSSFGMRQRIALALKGIEYEAREENLFDKSTLLLEMNSVHKKILVLIHNGNSICESLIILEYIDQVWHDKYPLFPSHPYERSQAGFWADYIDKKIYSTGRKVWSGKGEDQEKAKKEFIEIFKTLEGELGDKTYFGGDNLGFVDLALTCANFSIEAECPKLVAWAKRCMQIESVSNSLPHPHNIYAYVLELKHKLGLA